MQVWKQLGQRLVSCVFLGGMDPPHLPVRQGSLWVGGQSMQQELPSSRRKSRGRGDCRSRQRAQPVLSSLPAPASAEGAPACRLRSPGPTGAMGVVGVLGWLLPPLLLLQVVPQAAGECRDITGLAIGQHGLGSGVTWDRVRSSGAAQELGCPGR